jgi:hypothetical protein
VADLLQLTRSVQPTAIIDSSKNSKLQIPNPNEYPIVKRKPTARGLKGEPSFRIALVVGAWNWSFRDLYGRGWLNILYEGASNIANAPDEAIVKPGSAD